MSGSPLDLSSADTKGFDAIPSGPYQAHIEKAEPVEVKGDDGKMPKGTPGYNVTFRVDGGEYDNRPLWNRYWLPSSEQQPDEEKRNRMLGMFVRFLVAVGYAESDVTSGKWKFDPSDLEGRKCTVIAGQREYNGEMTNTVRNVKPVGENIEAAGLI